MSADNGIYILATQGDEVTYSESHRLITRCKTEYRVALAQAIGNIYFGQPNPGQHVLNAYYTLMLFGQSRVFTDRKYAEGYALALMDERGEDTVEYGITFLDFRHVRFPRKA